MHCHNQQLHPVLEMLAQSEARCSALFGMTLVTEASHVQLNPTNSKQQRGLLRPRACKERKRSEPPPQRTDPSPQKNASNNRRPSTRNHGSKEEMAVKDGCRLRAWEPVHAKWERERGPQPIGSFVYLQLFTAQIGTLVRVRALTCVTEAGFCFIISAFDLYRSWQQITKPF